MSKLCPKIFSVLLLAWSCLPATEAAGALFQNPSPPVPTGLSFPTPPRQYDAWQLSPTSLPQTFSTATTKLFEQGLADPRGCEYRQIEIVVHSIWGGATTVKTHGWVLPQSVKATQRFVIGWNGLIYPALSVGAAANLKEDVLAAIDADEAQWTKAANTSPLLLYRLRTAWPEGQAVSHKSLLPLKAALLLRLGENVLAKQVWTTWTSQMNPKVNDDALLLHDPYPMLAGDWIWARFERTLCAHMRGDDRLALIELRFLEQVRNSIADTMAERSSSWPAQYKGNTYLKSYYFAFLEPVPVLLADPGTPVEGGPCSRTAANHS